MVLVEHAAGDQLVRSSWKEPDLGPWRARDCWRGVLAAAGLPGEAAMHQ